MAERRIMKMKIYLNCVREHCVVFKHLVIQLNHRSGFHMMKVYMREGVWAILHKGPEVP